MKYKVLLHWGDFKKYPPREGEMRGDSDLTIDQILEKIFILEQNECNTRDVPSASELDVIVLESGRRFRILDVGFNELCSRSVDRYCNICSKFYLKREDVSKAIHFNVKNTFYNGRNNLCRRCFEEYGIKD